MHKLFGQHWAWYEKSCCRILVKCEKTFICFYEKPGKSYWYQRHLRSALTKQRHRKEGHAMCDKSSPSFRTAIKVIPENIAPEGELHHPLLCLNVQNHTVSLPVLFYRYPLECGRHTWNPPFYRAHNSCFEIPPERKGDGKEGWSQGRKWVQQQWK